MRGGALWLEEELSKGEGTEKGGRVLWLLS